MTVHHYKLIVSYKGTRYMGWQVQPDGMTVQGELEKALKKISKSENIRTLGSGRTDAGVHALGQVVKVDLPLEIDPEALLRGMNSLLPQDIKVLKSEWALESFHPLRDSLWKEYHYLFSEKRLLGPFSKDYIAPGPHGPDFEGMKRACKLFKGTYDFRNFRCVGTDVPNTTRTILECDLVPVEGFGHEGLFCASYWRFRVKGEGFLKQMVRLMMGSVWEVGKGRLPLDELERALRLETEGQPGPVAPAQGLYLMEVAYSPV